jgi:N-acetylglutamate synthase-like GNAT family acetyltransferase
MKIKKATLEDAFMILLLLKEMHEGTILKVPDIKIKCLANKVDSVIKTGIVFVSYNNEKIITGSIGGTYVCDWWSDEKYLSDLWFFVSKNYRKSRAGLMLVKNFINYSKSVNIPVRLGHVFSGDIERKDKFFERLGFVKAGSLFVEK